MENEKKQEKVVPAFSYYSNVLNKKFDSLSELKEAEKNYAVEQEKLKLAQLNKKTDAAKVEAAYKKLIETQVKANKEIEEARKVYMEARKEFIEKYGSYHATYTNMNGEQSISVSDIIDSFFDVFNVFRS